MTGATFTPAEIRELIAASKSLTLRKAFTEGESEAFALCERMDEALEYLLQFVEWQPISAISDMDPDGEALSYTAGEKYHFHRLKMRQGKPFIIGDFFAFDRKSPSHILPFPPPPEEKEGSQ